MKFNVTLKLLENTNSFYKATSLINDYKNKHAKHNIVSLGIGDVSFPITEFIANEMEKAVKKEASCDFVGYGNYYGINDLKKAIQKSEYNDFLLEEIYVSHGTKSDCGDLLELFSNDVLIGIPEVSYPIYANSCISLNKKFEFLKCDEEFFPIIPEKHFDVLFLCSPCNPTGANFSKTQLNKWVEYANRENCIIIYDNVYFKFIENGVKSIYEIPKARKCAIELRSFSKHASFTGIRCSYYVIPNDIYKDINKYWRLRTINRFNGASFIAQIGALASFDENSQIQINKNINFYKENALFLKEKFTNLGYQVSGGINAPYLWIKTKNNKKSWEFFNELLNNIEVVIVPGAIFGEKGDEYFRVSALGKRNDIKEAMRRIEFYEQKNK